MTTTKSKLFNLLLAFILTIGLSTFIHPVFKANKSENAFTTPEGGSSIDSVNSSDSIPAMIVSGAGYFMESYVEAMTFLQRIEVSDPGALDFNELKVLLDTAVDKMTLSKVTYQKLKEKAEVTPYNPSIIERLKDFDYNALQQEKGLIKSINDETAAYLKTGDVRGIYAGSLESAEIILKKLEQLKTQIDAQQFPNVSDCWRLNQSYSHSLLIGQYVAEVFTEILK